ncbi:alpha-1-3-glucanase/mutanase [Penicillium longicatenatum]|uniref:alpha-1-3-glucanase/mutanase n=1 Tax=Penicillium longicatenatum TaxID=1561947 RepID=UPI0025499DBB|nr:alpha-1-3-glucanase/mutanase [Penicillium longicatenatum]KAJ5630913.1 alpha-1-3-glucanase/mutanase [Penicillium longicatenatum]
MALRTLLVVFLSVIGIWAKSIPISARNVDAKGAKQDGNHLVFAHFMIGITSDRSSASAYDDDMQRAKSLGIDAFALNIGVDPYTDQQLEFAYQSAATNNMKVFLSFDFNWWNVGQASAIGQKIAQYGSKPAQLMVDGKIFVSSFSGDGLDVAALRAAVGKPIFFAPNFHPATGTNISPVDGLLNWMAWPNNGNNKAPTAGANVSVADGDKVYVDALKGKAYVAPVSPWFSTHFGPEVSYSKNWVFPSDLLWYNRWNDILALGPRFIEIITWNDYGESHYIGPLKSPHTDDGASRWVNDMPHDGWLEISKPFIAAFKDGASAPDKYITDEKLVYWYRPAPRDVNCDATDTCMVPANNGSGNYFLGRPDGWQSMQDSVFVVTLLKSPASVEVNSGGTVYKYDAPAGASAHAVPMKVGVQAFSMSRSGQSVLSGTSLKPIINGCVCGLYNFNAYVGTLPPGFDDPLQPDGLAAFTQGLHVTTCRPTPSLGTNPPVASTTSSSSLPPTGPTTGPPTGPTTGPPTTTPSTTSSTTPSQSGVSTITLSVTNTVTQTVTATSCPSGGAGGGGGSSGGGAGDKVCTGGTGPGNYVGLCNFCCGYGYCPSGPCTCTQYGAPVPAPPSTGKIGLTLPGEDDSYTGLCSFACGHGYCPPTACTTR